MRTSTEIERLLNAQGGVIARRDHPELRGTLDWLVRSNQLLTVLPGVYAAPAAASDPIIRMRAAARRYPDAAIIGGAAARLTYWPDAPMERIELAMSETLRSPRGFSFTRRRIPPELVLERSNMRVSAPALTAIDLATMQCADAIDIALRTRRATLAGMHDALHLTSNRAGNFERRLLLLDSRDEPWSAAERQSHRLLRGAGIGGWKSNLPVKIDETLYYIDVAFRRQRLALEIDGRLHEDDADLFESDRWRQNALVLDGWRVLRFTWTMLREHPEMFVAVVRQALRS